MSFVSTREREMTSTTSWLQSYGSQGGSVTGVRSRVSTSPHHRTTTPPLPCLKCKRRFFQSMPDDHRFSLQMRVEVYHHRSHASRPPIAPKSMSPPCLTLGPPQQYTQHALLHLVTCHHVYIVGSFQIVNIYFESSCQIL